MADATLAWLDTSEAGRQRVAALEQRFADMHRSLLRDTPTLAADAIEELLAR